MNLSLNKESRQKSPYNGLRKILYVFVLCMLVQLNNSTIYAQKSIVTLNMNNVTIEKVINEIESKTDFRFLYNNQIVDVSKKITIVVSNKDIKQVLPEIFKNTDIVYTIKGIQIVLSKSQKNENATLANSKKINGLVTDNKGEPIIGASVFLKASNTGTITNIDGKFSLEVPDQSQITISYIGFKQTVFKVGKDTNYKISLEEDSKALDEVVVVGYGTQRKGEMSVSVSQLKGSELTSISKISAMDALGGRIAGVDVVSSSGAPGVASSIRIRGANSITSNASPLYVIDGFPVASNGSSETSRLGVSGDATDIMSMINPDDIASFEILKDAAATSIYGSRGSNGVILITTKSGRKGKSDISLSINRGIQVVAKQYNLMNSTQFSNLLYDEYEKGGINMSSLGFDPSNRLAIPTTYNTNWQDEILQTGDVQDYNLSFSGASDNANFSGSVGYLDSKGIIITNSYKRYSARLNTEAKGWNGRLRVGLNTNLSYVDEKDISTSGVYQAALTMAPNYPVYYPENTEYAGYYTTPDTKPIYTSLWGNGYGVSSAKALLKTQTPFYQTNVAQTPTNRTRAIANSFLSLEPIKGLIFKTSFGADLNFVKMKYLIQSVGPYRPTGGSLEHKQDQDITWLTENTVTYSFSNSNHVFSALLGQSAQKYYKEGLGFAAEESSPGNNFIGNDPFFVDGWYFNNGVNDHLTDTHKYATVDGWTVASYFTRLNYAYQNKYMVTATVRRDGSSKFGKDSKWGNFPGIAGAWVISKEKFFNTKFVDYLKLRASWGVVGNGNIGNYLSQSLLTSTPSVLIGEVVAGTATSLASLTDPTLRWESTEMVNLAFDGSIYNRFNITSEVYWKNTSDLLYGFDLPLSTGFSNIATTNIGSIKYFGVELTVNGDIIRAKHKNDFSWNVAFNADHLKGKITDLPSSTKYVGSNIRSYVNGDIGQIYGYQVDGIYNTQAEIADPANPNKSASLGDYKYHDFGRTDKNGQFVMVPDTLITGADRVNLGSVNPIISLGFNNTFNYKNFDLNLFFRSSIGNKIYNSAKSSLLNTSNGANVLAEAINRWTPQNQNQNIQAANSNRVDPTGGSSPLSIFVEDGSYLRLANLSFGYTFPENILKRLELKSLRIYSSINNVFVLTGYSGLDPEVGGGDVLVSRGIDNNTYPKTRTLSFGLQVTF